VADRPAYGEGLAGRFGVRAAPVLVARTLLKTQIGVTLIESSVPAPVMSDPLPAEDAFLIHYNVRACPDHELWIGDRSVGKCTFGAGETAIHDLKQPPRALVHTPMGSMMYYLSRKLLNEIADESNVPRIGDLHLKPGMSVADPMVRHLSKALYAAMQQPDQAAPLFVDHVTLALAAHVAETYGGMRKVLAEASGGLAPWQERRAKEMLSSQLDGDISLETLAAECGISRGHFAKMFRRSVGIPPYRWLLLQRVERAKELIRDSSLSLAEIAIACGFCDQSHMTRCFKEIVGVSPGACRRNQHQAPISEIQARAYEAGGV
jgi:AraC family transcriptional regulator